MGSTVRFILFFQINPFRSTAIKTKEYIRTDHKAIIKRFEMKGVDVNSYKIDIADYNNYFDKFQKYFVHNKYQYRKKLISSLSGFFRFFNIRT